MQKIGSLRLNLAMAALLLAGVAAGPAHAQMSAMDFALRPGAKPYPARSSRRCGAIFQVVIRSLQRKKLIQLFWNPSRQIHGFQFESGPHQRDMFFR